jgi:3-hydroxyisobutyrate dehydrogenase
VSEDRVIAFIGLGKMGMPMSRNLIGADFDVRGYDLSAAAQAAFAAQGGTACTSGAAAAKGSEILITMLPDSTVVRAALLGPDGAAAALAEGALVIDMSSAAPLATRALGHELAERGIALIDAPVSGGVRRAISGTLTVMAGGEAADIARARPVLEAMAERVFTVGALGAGHAVKALNNYVSAAGFAAACEALLIGRAFSLDEATIVDVLNASTGRNNSTEVKLKPCVLSGTFDAGFALALMAKDIRTAAELAAGLGRDMPGLAQAAALWQRASAALGEGADHTEIYRFLAARADGAD